MAFIETPNTALVELRYILWDQVVENTLWVEAATPMSEADLSDIADFMYNDFWLASLQAMLSDSLALVGIRCTAQDSTTAPMFESVFTSPSIGGTDSDALPGNSAFSIRFTTSQRGRSYRGRNYVTGIPSSVRAGNSVTLAWASGVVAAYANLAGLPAALTMNHVVVSHYTNGGARANGITTPVTGYGFSDLWLDNMDRRLTNRGS